MKQKRAFRILVLAAQNFLILGFAVPLIQSLTSGRPIEEVVTRWEEHIILWGIGALALAGASEWAILRRRKSESRAELRIAGEKGGSHTK